MVLMKISPSILLAALKISFAFATEARQQFGVPPLCGKSLIINTKFKRYIDERNNSTIETSAREDEERITQPLISIPFIASVQRFDPTLDKDVDIFDKRLIGAFVGIILGPSVVLVPCRCVARHLGRVGDDQAAWDPRSFGVMAGTPWDYSPVDGIVGQLRFANRISIHPNCELAASFFLWDMAVLVLKFPFIFIENIVGAAPIPGTSDEIKEYLELAASQGMSAFTAGWSWSFNSYKPYHLKLKLHPLFVRDWNLCYHSAEEDERLIDMYLCIETAASFLRLQRTGDVGSPLMGFLGVNDTVQAIQYIVLGIKSKEDGARPDGFSQFTRLDVGLGWLQNIKRNPPKPVGSDSAMKFALIFKVVLFILWAHILNILGGN